MKRKILIDSNGSRQFRQKWNESKVEGKISHNRKREWKGFKFWWFLIKLNNPWKRIHTYISWDLFLKSSISWNHISTNVFLLLSLKSIQKHNIFPEWHIFMQLFITRLSKWSSTTNLGCKWIPFKKCSHQMHGIFLDIATFVMKATYNQFQHLTLAW